MSHRALARWLVAAAAAAVASTVVAACGSTSAPPPTATATPKPTPTPTAAPTSAAATLPLAGTFTGSWTDTTFSTNGTLTATVDLTGGVFTATTNIGGAVFGGAALPTETFTGTLTAAGVTASGTSPSFGPYTLTATPSGDVTFTASNVPSALVATVVAHGTGSATGLTGTYQVTFRNGTAPAAGTFTLTHT